MNYSVHLSGPLWRSTSSFAKPQLKSILTPRLSRCGIDLSLACSCHCGVHPKLGRFTVTRKFTSTPNVGTKNSKRPSQYKREYIFASLITVAVAGYILAPKIKYGYEAAERSGRVAFTLIACINDYRKTLEERTHVSDLGLKTSMLEDCHKRCAERTLVTLEKNGGIFIKLGQHLSAMNYLLPLAWTTTFIPLQDRCPVSSFSDVQAMYLKDTGRELLQDFSEFASVPIGAASLAQVHLATVRKTGERVAVKVQHPELAQWASLDMELTKFTFSMLKRFFPVYDLSWLSDEMEVSLPAELNFEYEADNASRTTAHFSSLPQIPLVIPRVISAQKRILVMAYEAGHRLDDLEYLDSSGIDRDEVSATLSRIFNEMIFSPGVPLHCDPHGGNIAIRQNTTRRGANFDIILYDHGLYRDIPLEMRRNYAKMWLAVINGDMEQMKIYAKKVAGIPDDKFALFAAAITGRDFSVLNNRDPNTTGTSLLEPRTQVEKESITGALQGGLLPDLVEMLGQVPRVMLLILKTNDLTRALDESLQTRLGPVRTFLILARYCAKTVLEEKIEIIGQKGSSFLPTNLTMLALAYMEFFRVDLKLGLYEWWIALKRLIPLYHV